MTAPHLPYVQPFGDAVGKYVARCDAPDCGLFREFMTEEEANERVAQHEAEAHGD